MVTCRCSASIQAVKPPVCRRSCSAPVQLTTDVPSWLTSHHTVTLYRNTLQVCSLPPPAHPPTTCLNRSKLAPTLPLLFSFCQFV